MGLRIMSSCTAGCSVNPDPARFTIIRHLELPAATLVEVHYPDADNYEGRKILVYRAKWAEVAGQKILDPHFCEHSEHLSPFARFEPTEEGWAFALTFAALLR